MPAPRHRCAELGGRHCPAHSDELLLEPWISVAAEPHDPAPRTSPIRHGSETDLRSGNEYAVIVKNGRNVENIP
ncbi:hypothetical protein [Rhodococcus sp. CH91]|uniref:hypothetical protein n=1 Tax=Rhodococcus sp. CH91 TaxID=2910256 RepID=UPI001F4A77A8|nr:hypothetical protein [Rhodococcus sp. CH91]